MRDYIWLLAEFGHDTVRGHAPWMVWNLILAGVPATLAVVLFGSDGRRGPAWWAGVVVMLAFLPNAPYVVTDLIHLRWSVALAPTDGSVVLVVLPLYAAFIGCGLACYRISLWGIDRELTRRGLATWRLPLHGAVHVLCAVGVLLGRVARVNSWEVWTAPGRVVDSLGVLLRPGGVAFVLTMVAGLWLVDALLQLVLVGVQVRAAVLSSR